ncbi:MAG: hypothetical protein VW270_04275 [Candidatus Poseidoniales archaeon]
MKIDMIPLPLIPNKPPILTRVVVIEKGDECNKCENCGGRNWSHPLLYKDEKDWCINCDDAHSRNHMSDEQFGEWVIDKLAAGYALTTVYRGE